MAAGSVTWVLRFQNTNWGANQFKGWWGHRPTATGNDIVKAMTTLSSSALSHGSSNYSDTTTLYFSLTRPDWHPTIYVHPLINRALEKCWQWWRTVLTPVTDGDMETSGVTNWTATNSTRVKDTTIVWQGTASMDVTNTSANGYVQSASFLAVPNRSFRFSVKCRPRVGTQTFTVYDVTNSAVITSSSAVSGVGAWQDVMVTGTFPATCYQAAVRLGGVGTTDRANWDDVTGYWDLQTRLDLPSWVTQWRTEEGEEALRIYKQANRLGTDNAWAATAYDLSLVEPRDYQILQQPSAVGSLQLEMGRDLSGQKWPLIVEARRPFSDFGSLSADTDTTGAPLRLVVAAAKCLAALERRELSERLPMWEHDFVREQQRVASVLLTPALDDGTGLSWQRFG